MEEDTETTDTFSIQESVDFDYLREMYQYEINAKRETDSVDVSLEEENQIVCQIKEDILNQVRDEMASELEKYQLITGRSNITMQSLELNNLDEMDPIIRKGLYQIKKLDKILLRKIQKEKEVKRERILLQKRLREELNEIESNNKQLSKEIKTNVMKFLALKPPLRHNEGLNEYTAEDEIPRLFQTEINDENIITGGKSDTVTARTTSNKSQINDSSKAHNATHMKFSENPTESRSSEITEAGVKEKNFIKRNIELASKASEPILLTEDEKNRLDFLLADLDIENDSDLTVYGDNISLTSKIEENPFQLVTLENFSNKSISRLTHVDGFQSALSKDSDITSIEHQLSVESRLRMYMGNESYHQLSRFDEKSHDAESFSYQLIQISDLEMDIDNLGEKSLKEVKYSRESQKRLQEIDDMLMSLKDNELKEPLDEKVLQILINSSRDIISRSNMSNISELNSEYGVDYLHSETTQDFKVEKLSQEVLDSLLKEARQYNMRHKELNSIEELTEYDENLINTDPRETCSICSSPKNKNDKSSRFPDINIYKQMTSPATNL